MAIRPIQLADRANVIALLGGDLRALDISSNHTYIAEGAGASIVGATMWHELDAGDEAMLGPVIAPIGRRDIFYGLVKATAKDAIARGFVKAIFTLKSKALLEQLEQDFTITAEPSSWNPQTQQAIEWRVHVDLGDAIRQLDDILASLTPPTELPEVVQ